MACAPLLGRRLADTALGGELVQGQGRESAPGLARGAHIRPRLKPERSHGPPPAAAAAAQRASSKRLLFALREGLHTKPADQAARPKGYEQAVAAAVAHALRSPRDRMDTPGRPALMSGGQHPHLLRRGLLLGHRMWMVAKLIYMEQMMLGFENWWLSPLRIPSPWNLPF